MAWIIPFHGSLRASFRVPGSACADPEFLSIYLQIHSFNDNKTFPKHILYGKHTHTQSSILFLFISQAQWPLLHVQCITSYRNTGYLFFSFLIIANYNCAWLADFKYFKNLSKKINYNRNTKINFTRIKKLIFTRIQNLIVIRKNWLTKKLIQFYLI